MTHRPVPCSDQNVKFWQRSESVFASSRNISLRQFKRLRGYGDLLVHGQVTIIFVVSVGLSVCLFVQFFSAVFDPISIKLGNMLYVWI